MSLPSPEDLRPDPAPISPRQDRRRVGSIGRWRGAALGLPLRMVAASAFFLAPLLLLPLARAADPAAWQAVGLRGETVRALSVVSGNGERLIYAETATGLWRCRLAGDQAPATNGHPPSQVASGGSNGKDSTGRGGARTPAPPECLWERIDAGLPRDTLGGLIVAAWRVVPGRIRSLYALTGSAATRQLHRSTDGGNTWQVIGPAPGQTSRPPMVVSSGLNGTPDTIAVVTDSRVQRSTDGGANWAPGGPWPGQNSSAGSRVRAMLGDSSTPERLFALTETGEIWISESGGRAWRAGQLPVYWGTAAPATRPPSPPAGLNTTAPDAGPDAGIGADPTTGQHVTALAITPYFGVRIWAAIAAGRDAENHPRQAGALAYSADNGTTWVVFPLPASGPHRAGDSATSLVGDLRTPDTVYLALGATVVYRSDDGGARWVSLGQPGAAPITALALDPETREHLYAATADGIWVHSVTAPQPADLGPVVTVVSLATETAADNPTPPPSATNAPSSAPTAVATETRTPTPSPTATASSTPTPTATPTPSRTPSPSRATAAIATATRLPPTPSPTPPAASTATPQAEPVSSPTSIPATPTQPPPTPAPTPAPTALLPTATPFNTPEPR